MGDLSGDHRTRRAFTLFYSARPALASGPFAEALLAELGRDEVVERFLDNGALRHGSILSALTRDRLILVTGAWRVRVVSFPRPLTLRLRYDRDGTFRGSLADGSTLNLVLSAGGDAEALLSAGAKVAGVPGAGNSSASAPEASSRPGRASRPQGESKPAPRVRTWQDAEDAALAHMVHLGFVDARKTRPGADEGLDVVSSRAAAQVKHHQVAVSGPMVREFFGAAHTHALKLFYSRRGYTKAARDYAETTGVHLFQIHDTGQVTGENAAARALAANAAQGLSDPDAQQRLRRLRKAEELRVAKEQRARDKAAAKAREEEEALVAYCRRVRSRASSLRGVIRPHLRHWSGRRRKRADRALATLDAVSEQLRMASRSSGRDLKERRRLAEDAARTVGTLARAFGVKFR